MVTKITKMVPRTYYIIDGVEFLSSDVFRVLEMTICDEGDNIEYYLYECADKLVDLGYLNKRYGMRQCTVYEDTEDQRAAKLFKEIIDIKG